MMRAAVPALVATVLAAGTALLAWQVPPGGQYPPGQYPPGQYPPGQYPPNTYPTRLPGGVPVGIQIPEIKLPRREPRQQKDDVKVTLASVDGTLRKMREKDLFLQIPSQQILRFRLLAKTQFRNTQDAPIRDSLLRPGDRLSVQVNPDDEETALRVILVRPGTTAERSAAGRTFDESAARAPSSDDLGKPRTVAEPRPAEPEAQPEPAKPAEPAVASGPVSDDELIREARAAAADLTKGLPNFLVQQVTSRYFSNSFPARWQPIDVVDAEVGYFEGRETYRNVTVNGAPTNQPIERTGTWTTGEWATTLEDVLSLSTNAVFRRRAEDRIASRTAVVFDLTVAEANSHWTMVSPDGRRYNPPYTALIWIDKDTRRVLRIEQRTTSMPQDFPLSRAESTLDYGFVTIDQTRYLMPIGSDNLSCMRGSGACSRNTIEFRNYRKFTADSNVRFFAGHLSPVPSSVSK